ncbi:MAG: ribosomal RNA small subunit methyltransferase A [Bacteroidetes bacterium SW_11_45_7]|nr:MAG: ribosomal RNA small subunit methyltransferase A [Bacteroidetes bacterium SW_11_45_7]
MKTGRKKSMGQHFLHDSNIARKIGDTIERSSSFDLLVEIGPGKGMVTQYLVEQNTPLFVIELDRSLTPYLSEQFPSLQQHIITDDVLKVDPRKLTNSTNIAIVGNFPYNISSQILFWALEQKDCVSMLLGMFQKEVGKRITASPGNKDYGILSVLIGAFFHPDYLFDVSPRSFTPQPKVTSGMVRMIRRAEQDIGCDEGYFKKVVKAAFSQRRKTLRNSLQGFDTSRIKPASILQKRAEQLSIQDFISITQQMEQ